ncbi:MAG: hypothetical protein ACYTBS_01305 [Planctomycetota bacterium]|jgi:amino acid transporter
MNNLRSFARIALAATGIYFAFRLIDNMITLVMTMIFMGVGGSSLSLRVVVATVVSLLLLCLCFAAICYVCLYKREQLAERIVGTDEPADPRSEIDWLHVAFRLVCIIAGIYCLHSVIWRIFYALRAFASGAFRTDLIFGWLVMLAIGTYLVCGAPHFARWHVKKTLQQCRLQQKE